MSFARLTRPAIVFAPLLTVGSWAGPVASQPSDEARPLILTVRPSSTEEDPKARQERRLKRIEQSDYWVRSICSQCGDSWKHQIYAPFNPLEALGRRGSEAKPSPPEAALETPPREP